MTPTELRNTRSLRDQPVVASLTDGTTVSGQLLSATAGSIWLTDGSEDHVLGADRVQSITPI